MSPSRLKLRGTLDAEGFNVAPTSTHLLVTQQASDDSEDHPISQNHKSEEAVAIWNLRSKPTAEVVIDDFPPGMGQLMRAHSNQDGKYIYYSRHVSLYRPLQVIIMIV